MRRRPIGDTDQDAYNLLIDKHLNPQKYSEEGVLDDVDPIEDEWRGLELESIGKTFMPLREKTIAGLQKGIKTKSYYIVKYFIHLNALNSMNSADLKYFHKWVKVCINSTPAKGFLKSKNFLKLKEVYNTHADATGQNLSMLPLLLRQAGFKQEQQGGFS